MRCLLLVASISCNTPRQDSTPSSIRQCGQPRAAIPAASGLVNAVLRNFLRKQPALLEAADQKEESRYAYPQWWIDALKAQYGKRELPQFWKQGIGIRR